MNYKSYYHNAARTISATEQALSAPLDIRDLEHTQLLAEYLATPGKRVDDFKFNLTRGHLFLVCVHIPRVVSNDLFRDHIEKQRVWIDRNCVRCCFDPDSGEMQQLLCTRDALAGLDEPAPDKVTSRRQQLVALRNQLRSSLENVDAALKE